MHNVKATAQRVYGTDVLVEMVKMTPLLASQFLKTNKHNRPVSQTHVEFLAGQMGAKWQFNGEPIIISDQDEILDGQHRLLGCIHSGESFETLIVYGVPKHAFQTIDTGRTRNSVDAIMIDDPTANFSEVKSLPAMIKWVINLRQGVLDRHIKYSNAEVLRISKEDPSLIAMIKKVLALKRTARLIAPGIASAIWKILEEKDPQMAEEFMHKFLVGDNLKIEDIEFVLRDVLSRHVNVKTKIETELRIWLIIKAWNFKRSGRTNASPYNLKVPSKLELKDIKIL